MKRVLLALSFWLIAIGFVNAQEAFYIYRNDGDFNGFFYDEVVEMRQSKIGVDSIEYDKWVTQEVVLEDTIYRIPLAAIDSIGFEQPEIKINPRVRFLRDGLCQYLTDTRGGYEFTNLPADLMIKVGDVLIPLPDDECSNMFGWGEYGIVVEEVNQVGNKTYPSGRGINQISDVFDQYITVEQIGVDQEGKIHRRIAGCTPDGMPRKVKDAEGSAEVPLLNISGKVEKEWSPRDNISINLNAEVEVKLYLRVAYNITWKRFMVKMSQDIEMKVKPTIDLGLYGSLEERLDDWWVTLPVIYFPANCPVFQTRPHPAPFIRAQGKIEAELNLPAVRLGFGDDIIFDSGNLFPISFGMHMLPDDEKEVTEDMVTLSGGVKFSGYAQVGVMLRADVETANWFSKILNGDVGLFLYIGPKAEGVLYAQVTDWDRTHHTGSDDGFNLSFDPYDNLQRSYLAFSLLSFDLEAKAYAESYWTKPTEKTFFSKSWALLNDTVHFAPQFDSVTVDTAGHKTTIRIYPNKKATYLPVSWCNIGVFNSRSNFYQEGNGIKREMGDNWMMVKASTDPDFFEYTLTKEDAFALKTRDYYAVPYVKVSQLGPYGVPNKGARFCAPLYMELEKDEIQFGPAERYEGEVNFKTNADYFREPYGPQYGIWYDAKIDTIDEREGQYKAKFYVKKNQTLFDRRIDKSNQQNALYLGFGTPYQKKYLSLYQRANSLSDVTVDISSYFHNMSLQKTPDASCSGALTATRNSTNEVEFSGTITDEGTEGSTPYSSTYTVSFTIRRTGETDEYGIQRNVVCENGSIIRHTTWQYSDYSETLDVTTYFSGPVGGIDMTSNKQTIRGELSSGTYHWQRTYYDQSKQNRNKSENYTMTSGNDNNLNIEITVRSAQ